MLVKCIIVLGRSTALAEVARSIPAVIKHAGRFQKFEWIQPNLEAGWKWGESAQICMPHNNSGAAVWQSCQSSQRVTRVASGILPDVEPARPARRKTVKPATVIDNPSTLGADAKSGRRDADPLHQADALINALYCI